MIPRELLLMTESRAPGVCVYGAPGLKKTNAIHTLPPPICMWDIGEGGTSSLLPWIKRRRESTESHWVDYSDALRQQSFDMLTDDVKKSVKLPPQPLIDIVHFDNMSFAAIESFISSIGNFDYEHYNSLALDSLQEFSQEYQTFSKGRDGEDLTMNEVPRAWFQAQERAMIALRRIRNYRDKGVFVYMTGSEDISKDYVKNPLEKSKGQAPPEPYSIRGTVNLPGKLAEGLAHVPDILCHARLINGAPTWVTAPEALPSGDASWDAKDRFGRLEKYIKPDVARICVALYGKETAAKIYGG